MTITLERLAHSDINLLRELRNANADSFFDDTYITREMQEDWWWRLQCDTRARFFTIWLNKVTPVGFIGVRWLGMTDGDFGDRLFDVYEVGNLLLAPAHRGRGIMTQALIEVRRLHDPLTFWIAHVKKNNTASLRLFERAGFWNTNERKPHAHTAPDLHRRPQPQHRAR